MEDNRRAGAGIREDAMPPAGLSGRWCVTAQLCLAADPPSSPPLSVLMAASPGQPDRCSRGSLNHGLNSVVGSRFLRVWHLPAVSFPRLQRSLFPDFHDAIDHMGVVRPPPS